MFISDSDPRKCNKRKVVPALNKLSTTPWRYVRQCRYIAPPFLNSALDGGELSSSRSGLFNPGKLSAGTLWVGLILWTLRNGKKCLAPGNNRTPAVQLVDHCYTDWAISAPSPIHLLIYLITKCVLEWHLNRNIAMWKFPYYFSRLK
jgi:hypothetical protein